MNIMVIGITGYVSSKIVTESLCTIMRSRASPAIPASQQAVKVWV